MLSCVPAGPALQVAQEDGDTILVRQSSQLRVNERLQILPGVSLQDLRFRHGRHLLFQQAAFSRRRPRLESGAASHAIEPVGEPNAGFYRIGLASQNEKRRLESVFRILMVAEDAATDSPNQRAVSAHERCESCVSTLFDE